MHKTKMDIFVTLLLTFVLIIAIGNPSYALTNSISAKKQIMKASASVAKVEKTIKNKNFNPVIATKEIVLATTEVSKIKSLGKTYNSNYNSLLKRISMIKKRIADRRLEIVNKSLIIEAENAVVDAERIISVKNMAVVRDKSNVEASSKMLIYCQQKIVKALKAVSKLDRYSYKCRELLKRLDTINAMLSQVMSYSEFES